jgi:riboflavin synthase
MFTGLIEGVGEVLAVMPEGAGVRLEVRVPASLRQADASHPAVQLGDSVAINGCCLTVVAFDEDRWCFQAGSETLSRTNLGKLQPGIGVNLERALRADARLGGHFVQGHIDTTAVVQLIEMDGDWINMWFEVAGEYADLMVSKGSITIDGISLTLVDVLSDRFSVALIPHTLQQTTLSQREVGDVVNLETDILGKYIAKMLAPWRDQLPATPTAQ